MLEKIRERVAMGGELETYILSTSHYQLENLQIREIDVVQKFVGRTMHRADRQQFFDELPDDVRNRQTERLGVRFAHQRSRVLETFKRDFVSELPRLTTQQLP